MAIAAGAVIALWGAAPASALIQACDPTGAFCPETSTPEPATLSLLALGVAGLAIARRRK